MQALRHPAGWSGVKHTDIELWTSGNLFCGVTNHASLFCSLVPREHELCLCTCGGGTMDNGAVCQARHLMSSEGKS